MSSSLSLSLPLSLSLALSWLFHTPIVEIAITNVKGRHLTVDIHVLSFPSTRTSKCINFNYMY